jgi:hypothetical protein
MWLVIWWSMNTLLENDRLKYFSITNDWFYSIKIKIEDSKIRIRSS